MLYGNLKSCTYIQTTGNCSAGVGFFIALLISKYYTALISNEWYYFVTGLVIFMIPGLVSTYKQMKAGASLESIDLNKRPFKTF